MRFCTNTMLLILLLSTGVAIAQSQPPGAALPMNAVYVGADGKYDSAPDTALLTFNIAAQQDTSRAAYDKASAAAELVRQALKNNGIDPKTAEIGFFAVQPMYDWKNPKHKIIAYRVVTNVTLKLHDFTKVGAIADQMAEIDSTENQSLSYTLENIEAAKIKATEDAMRKARYEANAVATAGGRTLGELLYASVDVQEPIVPVPMAPLSMRAAVAGAAPPPPPTEGFTPKSVTINAHVNAMYGLK